MGSHERFIERQLGHPPWEGLATFLGAPLLLPELLTEGGYAVVGVPADLTSISGGGARFGPRAIREASLQIAYYFQSSAVGAVRDLDTARLIELPTDLNLADVGDVAVHNTDAEQLMEQVREGIRTIIARGAIPLVLGGVHTITYPAFESFARVMLAQRTSLRVGYVHVDHHCDFGDTAAGYGRIFSGAIVRRIMELDFMSASQVLLLGVGGWTSARNWNELREAGTIVVTGREMERGPAALEEAVHEFKRRVDVAYVSIDIDVVDGAYAPGRNSTDFGGIAASRLAECVDCLARPWVRAFDLCEVCPKLDPTGRTQSLAANLLVRFMLARANAGGHGVPPRE